MIGKNLAIAMMVAGACLAQSTTKPASATNKTATTKAKSAMTAAPAKSAKAAKKPAAPAATTPAKAAAPAKKPAKHKAAAASAAAPAANASAAPAAPATVAKKRDPFVNPIQAVREGRSGSCSGGKRCLAVNEIVLRGVVKSVNGMIAVVENSAQRTYFLHENDAVYDGSVQKITPDSVVFKEHYTDNLGRDQVREVVKSVNAPVV
jgi:hypothetical protein